jgi:hypothetical protein
MLPAFNNQGFLPKGIHPANLAEVIERFGTTEHRQNLLVGLQRGLENLRLAGCKTAYLDGSFVTDKPHPNDFDVCWDTTNVNPVLLEPELLLFRHARAEQKAKYGGEFIPSNITARLKPQQTYLEFFQLDKTTQMPKGIVQIHLQEETP